MHLPYQRRGSLRHALHVLLGCALLVHLWGNGCREEEPAGNEPLPVHLNLRLIAGSRYVYNTWQLDLYGSRVSSTLSRRSLKVADTAVVYGGFSNVNHLIDSVYVALQPGVNSLDHVDSMYLRVTANGDVFWFGFLADLIEKREGSIIESRWDKVVSPSSSNGSWSVGTTDSAGVELAFGRFSADQELIAVTVNGVPQAVAAYRVDITSPRLAFTLWLTDAPAGFLRFREESDGFAGIRGSFQEITTLSIP